MSILGALALLVVATFATVWVNEIAPGDYISE